MRIRDCVTGSGIERADAEVLMAFVLQRERSWVFAHSDDELSAADAATFAQYAEQRRAGEPVAYITGVKEFFHRTFAVDRRVLVPRPATEGLTDLVVSLYKKSIQMEAGRWHMLPIDTGIVAAVYIKEDTALPAFLVDIGTGSGCIAITLACELHAVSLLATDISPGALEVARFNAHRNHASNRIRFALADGADVLRELTEPFFLVSNPPYIPDGTDLETDVRDFEPHGALFGGADGADMVRLLANAALTHPLCAGIALECRQEQAAGIADAQSR